MLNKKDFAINNKNAIQRILRGSYKENSIRFSKEFSKELFCVVVLRSEFYTTVVLKIRSVQWF